MAYPALKFLLNIYKIMSRLFTVRYHSEGLESPAEDCGQCSFSVDLFKGRQSFMCGSTGEGRFIPLNFIYISLCCSQVRSPCNDRGQQEMIVISRGSLCPHSTGLEPFRCTACSCPAAWLLETEECGKDQIKLY